MKTFLRILVLIIGNLITLPLQLVFVGIYKLTNWKTETREAIQEFFAEGLKAVGHWIKTGDDYVQED